LEQRSPKEGCAVRPEQYCIPKIPSPQGNGLHFFFRYSLGDFLLCRGGMATGTKVAQKAPPFGVHSLRFFLHPLIQEECIDVSTQGSHRGSIAKTQTAPAANAVVAGRI
jgi:hypothetical protein